MEPKNYLGMLIGAIGLLSLALWITSPINSQPGQPAINTTNQPLPLAVKAETPWTDDLTSVAPYAWQSELVSEDISFLRDALKKNPRLVNARDGYGQTGLMLAAEVVDLARAELLISFGANVNLKSFDNDSVTALHIMVRKKDLPATLGDKGIKFIRLLLKHGADLNSKDAYGRTPLHYIGGILNPQLRSQVLDILMRAGANLNAQDNSGDTPLHVAINFLHVNAEDFIEEVMNKYGNLVDPHVRNLRAETLVDYARNTNFMKTVQVLCKTGKWPCSRSDERGIIQSTSGSMK